MQDIKLTQDANGNYDISIANGDIEAVEGFDTSLLVSLFSDARAPQYLVSIPENQRGWICNTINENGRELGGLLWMVDQRKLTQDTLNDAIDYVRKSLNWYIEDGLLTDIQVSGNIVPRYGIQIEIIIVAENGVTETRYYNLWEVTGAD